MGQRVNQRQVVSGGDSADPCEIRQTPCIGLDAVTTRGDYGKGSRRIKGELNPLRVPSRS